MASGGSKRRKFGVKQRVITKPKTKRNRPKRLVPESKALSRALQKQLAESDNTLSPASARRKLGVKVPVARGEGTRSGNVQACPVNCPGEYVGGMWVHSKWCRYSAVLWRSHGKEEKDWKCPFDCAPIEISAGWTHPHTCPFWDETGRTPFDHEAPKVVRVAKGKEQAASVRREERFEDFPEAEDGDTELPF